MTGRPGSAAQWRHRREHSSSAILPARQTPPQDRQPNGLRRTRISRCQTAPEGESRIAPRQRSLLVATSPSLFCPRLPLFSPSQLPIRYSPPRSRGGRSADSRSGASGHPRPAKVRGRPGTRRGACLPQRREARLSALHRGDFGPGAALPSPAFPPDPYSELLAARSSCLAGGTPGLSSLQLRAAAARRHTSLPASGSPLEDAPHEQGWFEM
jgi:hypothetical protein